MEKRYKSVSMGLAMIFTLGLGAVFISSCARGGPSPAITQGAALGDAMGSVAGLLFMMTIGSVER